MSCGIQLHLFQFQWVRLRHATDLSDANDAPIGFNSSGCD